MSAKRSYQGLGALALIAVATTAGAQTSNDDEKKQLEEIVVTAQKMEQTAQSVSRSINVINADAVIEIGATDLQQVMDTIPGYGLAGFQNQPALRGVGNDLIDPNSPGGAPPVVVNVDGAGAGSGSNGGGWRGLGQNGFSASLFDVERVEVVMGPSGTMQGQNALAGAINVITRNPDLEAFDFNVGLQYGNYNQTVYNAGVNIPFGDTFAVRAAYQQQEHDPYSNTLCVTDIVLGPPGTTPVCYAGQELDTFGRQDTTQARIKALWQPSDAFRLVFAVQYDQDNSDTGIAGNADWDDPWQFRIGDPEAVAAGEALLTAPPLQPLGDGSPFDIGYLEGPSNYRYSAEITWDMGWATLTDIAAYSTSKTNSCQEGEICNDDTRIANELRLQGVTESGFEWIVGYYFDEFKLKTLGCGQPGGVCEQTDVAGVPAPSVNINQAVMLANALDRGLVNPAMIAVSNSAGARDSQSLYASFVWPFTDTARLRAGLRFAEDNAGSNPTGYIIGSTLPNYSLDDARFDENAPPGPPPPPGAPLPFENYTYDEVLAYLAALPPGSVPPNIVCNNCPEGFVEGPYAFSGSSQPFNWNVVWEWDFADDAMMYAGLNTGYRAGGVQQIKFPAETFDPEEVLQYSLGFKTRMRDNTVQWNTELYYYNFKNFQVQLNNYEEVLVEVEDGTFTFPHIGNAIAGDYGIVWPDPILQGEGKNTLGFQTQIINIKNQSFIGLESNITALVTDNDQVSASLSLADRRFGYVPWSGPNMAGQQVANSPEVSGFVTYQHYFNNFLGGTLTPRVTVRYASSTPVSNEIYDDTGKLLEKQLQDSYWKYDANVSWASNEGHWKVNLYGNNLGNTGENRGAPPFDPLALGIPVSILYGTVSPPRTYGLRVDYNFN